MSKSQHTEAQMIGALKQLEAGRKAEDLRKVGVSQITSTDNVVIDINATRRSDSLAMGSVDDFVTVRASTFNTDQQFSTRSVQQVQFQSITNYRFQ